MMKMRSGLLAAAVLVVAAAIGGACGDDGEAKPEPTQVPFPDLTPFAEGVATRLHEIRDGVSRVRGLPVFVESQDGTVSREELQAYADSSLQLDKEERREIEAFTQAFRLLGLIGPDDDLLDITSSSFGSDVLGLYFYDDDKLVLIGDGTNLQPGHEVTLAHEYLHSLQDGFFDFERFDRLLENENKSPETTTEYDATIDCLREGDATFGSFVWANDTFGEDWADVVFGEGPSDTPADDVPEALRRYGAFNYDECVAFVAALFREGGWEGVNEAYFRPPTSTEQVLDVGAYLSGERPTQLPPPRDFSETLGEGWERLDLDVFGAFDLYTYVASLHSEEAADRAASGWGAGWISVYRLVALDEEGDDDGADVTATPEPQDVLLHLALEWDTTNDYTESDQVFREIAATVSNGTARGDDPRILCWSVEDEHGFYLAEPNGGQHHLILATTQAARDAALSERIAGRLFSCPP